MNQPAEKTSKDRDRLIAAQEKGTVAKLATYSRLSGPGWLQSAITLGGGSLASSLYLGVVAGFALLWVQPIAMILGIVMLSGIAYVTLSTGERPFRAINQHVSPVLGWSWALATLAANMFWCLPQYSLATGVLEQNLLPDLLGPNGSIVNSMSGVASDAPWLAANAGKLLIAVVILIVTTLVTWSYDAGRWGIKLYELILKLLVAGIVICFFGVLWRLRGELDWGAVAVGFLPNFKKLFEPSDPFLTVLESSKYATQWTEIIVHEQREIMISAAATAVGINMTFLFPYSLLAKRWTKEFRGLAIFDLSTGMLIPFVLATSCVVIAATNRFHTQPVAGFLGEKDAEGQLIVANEKTQKEFYDRLKPILKEELGAPEYDRLAAGDEAAEAMLSQLPEVVRQHLSADQLEQLKHGVGQATLMSLMDQLPDSEKRIAAMLIHRSPFDLAKSLAPLTGDKVANLVFGLGVLGMTLSTITLLMLISGFVICEIFNLPPGGWAHRFGCLAAATGVLGPFVWSKAAFYLAVYVSVFGMMLLPIAYLSFLFLMNSRKLLGENMPTGGRRVMWNSLLLLSAVVATLASLYSIWDRAGRNGIIAMCGLLGLAIIVQVIRMVRPQRGDATTSPQPTETASDKGVDSED